MIVTVSGAGSESDLIVTQDWNGPNSGVVLIKNSESSRWLLQEWWDQKQFVQGNYPFQYEQVGSPERKGGILLCLV